MRDAHPIKHAVECGNLARYETSAHNQNAVEKGNLYLTENRLSWNKIRCAADNHNYMCHIRAKEFLDSRFN